MTDLSSLRPFPKALTFLSLQSCNRIFSRRFSSNVTNQAWTSYICNFPFPPVCANNFLFVASTAMGRAWDSESLFSVPALPGICLENGATLPDCYVSEQSVRHSCFSAVHCSPQCTLKFFSVLASLYLSSQLVAVPAAAHQTTSAQLSCCHLSFSPVGLWCGDLCWWAGCIPTHYCCDDPDLPLTSKHLFTSV